MAYLLKFLDIFRWKKHYGREWGIQKIFMDFIKEFAPPPTITAKKLKKFQNEMEQLK